MNLKDIREESIKFNIAETFFNHYSCSVLENIDFTVSDKSKQQNFSFYSLDTEYYLWAEAKKTKIKDLNIPFVQLILTIGKSNELRNITPPRFLGAFNSEKFALIPYEKIHPIFSQNDFNWNVTPSKHDTKEFQQLYNMIAKNLLSKNSYVFDLEKDEKELKNFIKENFKRKRNSLTQIEITKNNFVHVYERWHQEVSNSININWNLAKRNNILDKDFFLADLLSKKNQTILDNLYVLFKKDHYEYNRQFTDLGSLRTDIVNFKDDGQAHSQFWMKYKRPPLKAYQDYIIEKSSPLLVPQDIREIKGAYFTPQIWVQKSQEYIEMELGEDWQKEYYIWDCCAGTGNMENGLTNKYNVWVSTIDQADVDVIKQRIKNGANLLEKHVFQFDFLNDDFSKCPNDLLNILQDEEKRKKLIIYINPPIKEPTSSKTIVNKNSKHISQVAESKIKQKYQKVLGQGAKELSTQFLTRIYYEIPNAYIASFCTLKYLLGVNSKEFREIFKARLKRMFIVPAKTFDNVTGEFPYGFFIWNTQIKENFQSFVSDIYDKNGDFIGNKTIKVTPKLNIKDWLRKYKDNIKPIGWLERGSSDVQNNNGVFITLQPSKSVLENSNASLITKNNLIVNTIFLTVRRCILNTWINNRDQYLYPNNKWEKDKEFQSNCLTYALFSNNEVKSSIGKNYWIPFTEVEVDAKNSFESHFMTDFIRENNITFSETAKEVFNAGRELFKYYHSKPDSNPNASLYDIKRYFQGTNKKGNMNTKSTDEEYNMLIWNLKQNLKKLEYHIIPKIFEYEFLAK